MSVQHIHHVIKKTDEGVVTGGSTSAHGLTINWQDGMLVEGDIGSPEGCVSFPVNGAFLQTVVQICIERLQQFQDSPMRSRENAVALTHLETAQLWLGKREEERRQRGVLGSHQP